MNVTTQKIEFKNLNTDQFVSWLKDEKISRGYIVHKDGLVKTSNPLLEPFTKFITSSPDYSGHEGIFFEADAETDSLFVVAVHRTIRGAGQGGTRLKRYETVNNIFTDAMRLSKGMTEKNSFAQIWWGGGKSVIHPPTSPKLVPVEIRTKIFTNFGRFIASLNGLYVCAEDMNTTPEDMRLIHANNRFCTCIPKEIGGSSNPSTATAKGVFKGLLAGVHFLQGVNDPSRDLKGIHVLIEGAGNVGYHVLEQAVAAGARVTVFDNWAPKREQIRKAFPKGQVTVIENGEDLYEIEADVFSPNAIGATVNDCTISKLKVKLIAGAANNQLSDAVAHAKVLHEKGILYVPDFVINRMGIVNCADEQYGYLASEIDVKLKEVYPSIYDLLEQSKADNISPQFKSLELSEELSRIEHPIWKHRGAKIIDYLMTNGWGS
ncbi:MAG: glutamate dehydrogenase/leucine dehydrogenase [Flavobacteriales bacterium]|jgi:glutamate dehydrogenase/leucine dehydrogenase